MSRRRKQRRESASSGKPLKKGRARQASASRVGILWKIAGGLLLLGILALFGGYLWVRAYLRSEEFREQLSVQIGAAAKGKATVSTIDWHGSAMGVEEVTLQSKQAGDWELSGVETKFDLSGFWDKVWLVPQIEVRQARSEWDFRASSEQSKVTKPKSKKSKASSSRKSPGWLPNRTEVHELVVKDYEGKVSTDSGSYSWNGVLVRSELRNQATTIVDLTGGRFQSPYPWLGKLDLEEGILALSDEGLEVVSSAWTGKNFDELALNGLLGGKKKVLHGAFKRWQMETFLPEKWADLIGGTLNGEMDWEQKDPVKEGLLAGEVEIDEGILQSLPLLDRLAAYAGTSRFRKLTFEEAKVSFSKEGEKILVKDLVLFDEGLIRLEGEVMSDSKVLSGQLEVGVPPGLLAHIPGAEEKVFIRGKQGLLWTSVNLSGTWDEPEEDLSERMIRAAGERMFELIPETGQWALRYSGEALDQGTVLLLENQNLILEQGVEIVEDVIEQGGDVVEEGVKTGFDLLNGILGSEKE